MIPKIDKEIGILVYSTKFSGCGGKIRTQNEDFIVLEVLSKKAESSITEKPGYTVYKLKKHGIDTHHALNDVFKKHGLRLKALGLKDAAATTEQYACSMNKSQSVDSITDKKYSLKRIGFVQKPLSKKDMIGNHFTIKITDAKSNITEFSEFDKILNFYGYQRFGTKRPVTHKIGKSIVQRNFDEAVNLLLNFTSEYDSQENNELRQQLADKSALQQLAEKIPPQMDLERIVVSELLKHGNPLTAIHALPISIRRLYIQAYQSFIFNKTLSMAFLDGEDLFMPKENDVCYDKNGLIGRFVNDPSQLLAVPFVGYSYFKKTRFDYQISKILKEEEISPKDFFIKEMQETSNEGGFRHVSVKIDDYTINDNTVSFTLSRGSFATILLREIMKPTDPILAGF
ncbi:MAG: tRNA pseudouridine(13) synthase TruD [Nitrosopumilaceae archaeon]|nr:tRNA pseudouridine(13) synthase TruD [Nitrosopumilaceae archaeon]